MNISLTRQSKLDPETMLPELPTHHGLAGPELRHAGRPTARLGATHHRSRRNDARSSPLADRKPLEIVATRTRSDQRCPTADPPKIVQNPNCMRAEAEAHLQHAENERDKAIEEAREQLKSEAQRVRRQLRRLIREADRDKTWQEARQSAADVARSVNSEAWMGNLQTATPTDQPKPAQQDETPKFAVGDVVRVESLGLTGEIVEQDRGGRAVILSGSMRFQARPHMMTLIKGGHKTCPPPGQTSTQQPTSTRMTRVSDAVGDLDVRGSRVHMVESMIPQFIDRAFMQRPNQRPHHPWRRHRRAPPSRPRHLVTRISRRNLPTRAALTPAVTASL